MDKAWSETNKQIQKLLGKKDTFSAAIENIISFRAELSEQIRQIVDGYPEEAFYQRPFPNVDGYHSKTLSYSIWHIFRIEDIVAHEMIAGKQQILFQDDFLRRMHSPIITTGNELMGEGIVDFSRQLDVKELYLYAKAVMESTNQILKELTFEDTKIEFDDAMKDHLVASGCVSEEPSAFWLIDYWCGKNIAGLIRMPFTRHWIMHIEAMRRIKNKLCKMAKKGVDPIAYCGFSCNHCFLGEWCGSCRTDYNTCSFALCSPDHVCPNVACCKEKGIDGCYECAELVECTKGFYVPANDGANAAKAQAMYIRKYGKKAFLKVHDALHEKYDFAKTQEVLGQDLYKGLEIMERVVK